MKRWCRILILMLVADCLAAPTAALAAAPQWEQISARPQKADTADADKPEVYVREGYIYISTTKPVTVKITSIVGQLISQQNVPAGVSRIRIASRGIYILKAGTLTTRVTI